MGGAAVLSAAAPRFQVEDETQEANPGLWAVLRPGSLEEAASWEEGSWQESGGEEEGGAVRRKRVEVEGGGREEKGGWARRARARERKRPFATTQGERTG